MQFLIFLHVGHKSEMYTICPVTIRLLNLLCMLILWVWSTVILTQWKIIFPQHDIFCNPLRFPKRRLRKWTLADFGKTKTLRLDVIMPDSACYLLCGRKLGRERARERNQISFPQCDIKHNLSSPLKSAFGLHSWNTDSQRFAKLTCTVSPVKMLIYGVWISLTHCLFIISQQDSML